MLKQWQGKKEMHHAAQVCSSQKGARDSFFCDFFADVIFAKGMQLKINIAFCGKATHGAGS